MQMSQYAQTGARARATRRARGQTYRDVEKERAGAAERTAGVRALLIDFEHLLRPVPPQRSDKLFYASKTKIHNCDARTNPPETIVASCSCPRCPVICWGHVRIDTRVVRTTILSYRFRRSARNPTRAITIVATFRCSYVIPRAGIVYFSCLKQLCRPSERLYARSKNKNTITR